jgi:AcrR family transcriptional regulator
MESGRSQPREQTSRPEPASAPRTARGRATQVALLTAAREELVQRDGLLEVDSVAARAGLSVGAIYRRFESRSGLVAAVVEDFYARYRAQALEINPLPGGRFVERERLRNDLMVAFHYNDPLARVILLNLHLDAAVAVREVAQIDEMMELAAGVMALGQRRGELPPDRDPAFIGAMIVGGMHRTLAVALRRDPPIARDTASRKLWVLNAGIMGIDPWSGAFTDSRG